MSDSLRPHGLQHASPPCPLPAPGVDSNSCPLSHGRMPSNHLVLSCPLLLLPSIFPSIRVFQMSQFFTSGDQSIGVGASESVLPMNIPLGCGLVGSPCSPRDSPTPQFKSIDSSASSLPHGPTLTSTHDSWKDHGFD